MIIANEAGNTRIGKIRKTLKGEFGELDEPEEAYQEPGSCSSDEALTKLFYLALRNISHKSTLPIRDWRAALTRFTIHFGVLSSSN